MSTTALSVAWFAQPSCSHSATAEFQSQLSENLFDGSLMRIDVPQISQQSLERFERLRAIKANNQPIFSANDFQPDDMFGKQFLSHAVFASLLKHHISKLKSGSNQLLYISALGALENQFFCDSSPEFFFYDAYSWDSRKLQNEKKKFQINRPTEKVRDYVISQRHRVTREILTGNRKPIKKKHDLPSTTTTTVLVQREASLITSDVRRLLKQLSQSVNEILDPVTLQDFLSFRNALGVVLDCNGVAVTPVSYQQFMNEWESAPQPIQGATWIQSILWKWLYVSFPSHRSKFFDGQHDSNALKHKKAMARSRRLKGLNELIRNAVARGAQ